MTAHPSPPSEFVRAITRLDATALVVGSMIGSGIFIVSADIARQVESPGLLLLVWVLAGVVTLMGALTYGELAAQFPKAGGQYVYLREAISPLFGFLYGWTLFMVIQTGTIAAVAVGFARFMSVLVPQLSAQQMIGFTVALPSGPIEVGLSPQRLLAIASIFVLTWINVRGVRVAAFVQTLLTSIKVLSLLALILLGLTIGRSGVADGSELRRGVLAGRRHRARRVAAARCGDGRCVVRDGCLEQRRLRGGRVAETEPRPAVRDAHRRGDRDGAVRVGERRVPERARHRLDRACARRPRRHRGAAGRVRRARACT